MDEVLGTLVNVVRSYIGAKIDWLVVLGVLNLPKPISMLDVVKTFLGG